MHLQVLAYEVMVYEVQVEVHDEQVEVMVCEVQVKVCIEQVETFDLNWCAPALLTKSIISYQMYFKFNTLIRT